MLIVSARILTTFKGHVSEFLELYESHNLAGYNSGGYAYQSASSLLRESEVRRSETDQTLKKRETMVEKLK